MSFWDNSFFCPMLYWDRIEQNELNIIDIKKLTKFQKKHTWTLCEKRGWYTSQDIRTADFEHFWDGCIIKRGLNSTVCDYSCNFITKMIIAYWAIIGMISSPDWYVEVRVGHEEVSHLTQLHKGCSGCSLWLFHFWNPLESRGGKV